MCVCASVCVCERVFVCGCVCGATIVKDGAERLALGSRTLCPGKRGLAALSCKRHFNFNSSFHWFYNNNLELTYLY